MMDYNSVVYEHFFSPRNVEFNTDIDKKSASYGSYDMGERVQIWMDCNVEGKITYLSYKVLGGPYLIALLSIVSEALLGQTLEKALNYDFTASMLTLEVPKNKRYCAMLVEDIIKELINQY